MGQTKQLFTREQERYYESLEARERVIFLSGFQAGLISAQQTSNEIFGTGANDDQ